MLNCLSRPSAENCRTEIGLPGGMAQELVEKRKRVEKIIINRLDIVIDQALSIDLCQNV